RDLLRARLLYDVLLTAVFLAAFLVVFRQHPLRFPALLLGIPTLVGTWTADVFPGLPRLPLVVGFNLVAALFLALTVATILRVIYREEFISADSVYGAFCGYLLLGVAFGHLYCVLESVKPGSFRGAEGLTT